MNGRRRRLAMIGAAAAVLLMLCVGAGLVEAQTKWVRRWVDLALYDNRYHYLPCSQQPPLAEVERVLREHQDVIARIEAVHPGFVGVEVHPCGDGGNGSITFWYASRADRQAIEHIIGSNTFFGIPYNLNNR